MINGIVHVLKSGCRWCDYPPAYDPHTTIYNRFAGEERGAWKRLFRGLAAGGRSTETQTLSRLPAESINNDFAYNQVPVGHLWNRRCDGCKGDHHAAAGIRRSLPAGVNATLRATNVDDCSFGLKLAGGRANR